MPLRSLNISSSKTTYSDNVVSRVINFLLENYEIRINRFKPAQKEIISKKKKYLFPPTMDDISLHLLENEIAVSDTILRKIMNSKNQIPNFNPISEYFDSLEDEYKGISHIEKLSNCLKPVIYDKPESYYKERTIKILKKWLTAAVSCGLGDRINEVALGFIQEEEGTGKTTLCNMLCPEPLKPMLVKSDKEKYGFNLQQSFTENFLILFDEFVGLNKFTAENFKSTMSAPWLDIKDRLDPFPRRKLRIGNAMFTSNNKTGADKGFLIPSLGTRRFACIHIATLDYDKIIKDVDFDQVWAEALTLYNGGYQYQFGPDDFKDFYDYNQRFMIETNAIRVLEANFTKPINNNDGQWLQPIDILQLLRDKKVVSRDILNDLSPEKIGVALRQLGYLKQAKRVKGSPAHPYHIHPLF